MRIKFKSIPLVLSIAVIYFILFYYFIFSTSNPIREKNSFMINNKDYDLKNNFGFESDKQFNLNNFHQKNQVWEQLNGDVFFKITSGFYIIENSLLTISYISSRKHEFYSFDIKLLVVFKDKLTNSTVFFNAPIINNERYGSYSFNSINLNFTLLDYVKDISDYYSLVKKGNYKFYAFVRNSNDHLQHTAFPIEIKVRFIRKKRLARKHGSIICSKCLFLKKQDYKDLLWWIELNKLIGYKKIVFCNISIANTYEFNKLFDRYKNFVEVVQFKYLPNFIDVNATSNPHQYLTSYFQLKKNGKYHKSTRNMFDNLNQKECYWNNAGKYEHIAIIDIDETVIPRINSKILISDNFEFLKSIDIDESFFKNDFFNIFNHELKCSKSKGKYIDLYLKKLNLFDENLYFKMAFYLSDHILSEIFDSIEKYFNSVNTDNFSLTHYINVTHFKPIRNNNTVYNYSISIEGHDEIKYAKNLLLLYKNIALHSKEFYNKTFIHYSHKFSSFFYLYGRGVTEYCGKTIHNTEKTYDFWVHYPVGSKKLRIPFNDGHSSHFRDEFEINNPFTKFNGSIPIKELVFDFNYFNCFYKPLVKILKLF